MRKVLSLTLTLLLAATFALPAARAEVPQNLTVQGRLTDDSGDPASPGFKNFTFKIFNQESGGTEVWPAGPGETQLLTTDADGLWNAVLGTTIPIPNAVFQDSSRWLEVTVDDGVNPVETLPRIKLGASPYSANSDIMVIFQGGTSNPFRPLIQHSPAFPDWGLFYDDPPDDFVFKNDSYEVMRVKLFPGELTIPNSSGTDTTRFSATLTGDASADLHTDAINSDEMLNEPGLGHAYTSGPRPIDGTPIAVDSVSITAPTDGYVLVFATFTGAVASHSVGTREVYRYSISKSSTSIDFTNVAIWSVPAAQPSFTSVDDGWTGAHTLHAADDVTAGSHTYYMTLDRFTGAATLDVYDVHLSAIFFPTIYGTLEDGLAKPQVGHDDPSRADGGNAVPNVEIVRLEDHNARLEIELAELRARLETLETQSQSSVINVSAGDR